MLRDNWDTYLEIINGMNQCKIPIIPVLSPATTGRALIEKFKSYEKPYFHDEVPIGIARMVLLGRDSGAPKGHFCEVIVGAKKDLEAGTELDGEGGYTVYGMAERADIAARQRLLPMGLARGATLVRAVARDDVITYDDVELPESFSLELRRRQDAMAG